MSFVQKLKYAATLDVNHFRAGTEKMSQAVQAAEPKIGKAATAISGLSGVMGGALGQTNAFAGGVASLAAVFAGGGVLGVALAAAGTAVGAIVTHFQEAAKEAEESKRRMIKSMEEMQDAANRILAEQDNRITSLIRRRAELLGASPEEAIRDAIGFNRADLEGIIPEIDRLGSALERINAAGDGPGSGAVRSKVLGEIGASSEEELRVQLASLRVSRDRIDSELDGLETELELTRDIAQLEKERQATKKGSGGSSAKAAAPDEAEKARVLTMKELMDATQGQIRAERQRNLEALDAANEEAERIKYLGQLRMEEIEKERAARAAMRAEIQGHVQEVASFAQQSIDILISGEEMALAKIGALALRSIGERLVAEGGLAIAKGTLLGIGTFGLDPRAYGMVATGTAMVAAGVGLGAGATWLGSLGGSVGASSGAGASAGGGGSPGARSGTVGGGGGSRSDGGGPVTLNINYGTFAPRPEDTARDVVAALRYAKRSGALMGAF